MYAIWNIDIIDIGVGQYIYNMHRFYLIDFVARSQILVHSYGHPIQCYDEPVNRP